MRLLAKSIIKSNNMAYTALILSMQNTFVTGIPFWIQCKLLAWLVKIRFEEKHR